VTIGRLQPDEAERFATAIAKVIGKNHQTRPA
jgi:hypothetical protein